MEFTHGNTDILYSLDSFAKQTSSADISPASTPCDTPLGGSNAPKYGTVIPNRIFVGGIAANTSEIELKQFFSAYGAVKDSKIIADRAGVSKGRYGFITFESQEDADRIIKKESDNLIFRDRKLNIGPAVRKQQVLPRQFDSNSVLYSNGVPYTFQNGMAVFHSPEGGYPVAQAQPQTAVMVPQSPPVYVQPQYAAYQVQPSYSPYQTSPQWTSPATAQVAQWRYMTQSPTQAMTPTNPGYMFAPMASPELFYAQMPPQTYPELTDAATLLESSGVEGSLLPMEPNIPTPTFVTDVAGGGLAVPQAQSSEGLAPSLPAIAMYPYNHTSVPPATTVVNATVTPAVSLSATTVTAAPCAATTMAKHPTVTTINRAPYKKPLPTFPRRTYSSPTFLVRNGNKVQCVMMPPQQLSAQVTLMSRSPEEEVATLRMNTITPPPTAPKF